MYQLLDGKKLKKKIIEEIKISGTGKGKTLGVISVGNNKASQTYIKNKEKSCEKTSINFKRFDLSESVSKEELLSLISELNNNNNQINGFILQLPLPDKLKEFQNEFISAINPKKDVDGFHPFNIGSLSISQELEDIIMVPATPKGIIRLLDEYNIEYVSRRVVVVGRSNIVGKPIAIMMINRGATVTICNSKTKNLSAITRHADILIVAVGKEKLITADMVKSGVVIVDVGMNRNINGKIVGDVDFDNVKEKASFITPVPGGVGPMTVVSLLENIIKTSNS